MGVPVFISMLPETEIGDDGLVTITFEIDGREYEFVTKFATHLAFARRELARAVEWERERTPAQIAKLSERGPMFLVELHH